MLFSTRFIDAPGGSEVSKVLFGREKGKKATVKNIVHKFSNANSVLALKKR